jgi:tRNA-binding EMAP/Myf-like protein
MQRKNNAPSEPVTIEHFKQLDLRVGTIVEATRVPKTEKLYRVIVDMGPHGRKQTITSLVGYYEAEELLNKRVIFWRI